MRLGATSELTDEVPMKCPACPCHVVLLSGLLLSAGCANPVGDCRLDLVPFDDPHSDVLDYHGSMLVTDVTEPRCSAMMADSRVTASASRWEQDGTPAGNWDQCPGEPDLWVDCGGCGDWTTGSSRLTEFCDHARSIRDAASGPSGGYTLTCHDDRPGAEQCVHYTFDSELDRDEFYDACAGLASRTKDAHNCPSGATGGGFCRHVAPGRTSDTYTYDGAAAELESRCSSTGGTWM